jgi:prepilin-type processing-associated H-X9-DG protein
VNEDNWNSVFSFHPGGAQVVMCDGAVHFLNESLSRETLAALMTRSGEEAIDAKEWAR